MSIEIENPKIVLSIDNKPSLVVAPKLLGMPFLLPRVSYPLHPSLDVNRNPEVHDMMTKHFYYKVIDKWLWEEDDMRSLLGYLKITNGKVSLIDSLKKYKQVDETQSSYEKKVEFIEYNILSMKSMFKLLKKYIENTGVTWVELSKNPLFLKDLVYTYLKEKFNYLITHK
jgi:hypothetical protein